MSKSLINETVLTQVANHLYNEQFKHCAEMGLKPEALVQLQQPFVMSFLTDTPMSWVEVRMNTDVMERVLATAERFQQKKLQIERAPRPGATTTIIWSFSGLSPEDTVIKRLIMAIYSRRGRWHQLDGTLEHQVWYRWGHLMQGNQASLGDSLALLDIIMILAEEINAGTDRDSPKFISLTIVWSPIQSWSEDEFYSPDKSGQAQAGQPRSPTALYLVSVSSHLLQSASQVDAETEYQ